MAGKKKSQPSKRRQESKGNFHKKDRSVPFFLLWGFVIAYIVIFSYLGIVRYESYNSSAYDLGIMIQVIWNTGHGYFLQDSINMGYPMTRFWMAHWEFIFILIAFVYRLISHPYTIIILQTLVVGLGAVPLYWLAKEQIHDKSTAVTFAFAYLMYPAIQNANLADVHGIVFAAPLLIYAFYFMIKKNYKMFYLFGFLALICREDVALLLVMMGIYLFLFQKDRKHGLVTAIISGVYFLIWFQRMKIRSILGLPEFEIMPGAETHWSHWGNLSEDPAYFIEFFARKYNIWYFVYIFAPVVFISFIEWKILLIATPIFLINLSSNYYYTHDVEHYYSAIIAPFVFISAIYATAKIYEFFRVKFKGRFKERAVRENVFSTISSLVFVLAIVFFFVKSNALDIRKWKITDHHRAINAMIKKIPQDASLTAENRLVLHAAERREIYVFNDNIGKVDYILWDFYAPSVRIVNRSAFDSPYFWPDCDSIRDVLKRKDYGIIEYDDGVCIFKKGADYENGLRELAIDVGTAIENYSKKEVAPSIEFLGYNEFPLLKTFAPIKNSEAIEWKYAVHFTSFWSIKDSVKNTIPVFFKYQMKDKSYFQKHEPIFGVFPITRWQPNEIIKDEIFWEIPRDAVAGNYEVSVAFTDQIEEKLDQVHFTRLFDLTIENLEK
ncbi:MAG: DUF2079 domain-containing protein [bacterium]|nr:DUF2079 domain-containing protein [bacterium]